MRLRNGWLSLVAALLCAGPAVPAHALTLADLNAGAQFLSGDGNLEFIFGEGSVLVTGALNPQLDNYTVITLDDGFRLVGPIGVADGNVGDLLLEYSVNSTRGSQNAIVSAELFFNGFAVGVGARAKVTQDFSNEASLGVAVTGGGLSKKFSIESFAPTDSLGVVLEGIGVSTLEPGQLATTSVVDRHYSVIPEPATAILMFGGLTGLALMGRSRRRG